jgi:large subunit ribosomal protein L31
MKKGIHPESYRLVVFKDTSNESMFLSRSAADSKEKIMWEDGKEYPLIKVEISNTSHPFYTGKSMFVDTAGRIEKFKKRYEKKTSQS